MGARELDAEAIGHMRAYLRSGDPAARLLVERTNNVILRWARRERARANRWRRLTGFLLLSDAEWRFLAFCFGFAAGGLVACLIVLLATRSAAPHF